ncbi:MAG: L-threonylcarbamoyladenylate synthase [Sphaerochaeta sp.]
MHTQSMNRIVFIDIPLLENLLSPEIKEKEFLLTLDALHQLRTTYSLVLPHAQDQHKTAKTLMEGIARYGIDFLSIVPHLETKPSTITWDQLDEFLPFDHTRSFFIKDGLYLEFSSEKDSDLHSLFFHSFPEAVRWILTYPNPGLGIAEKIREGAALILKGGLVAFPTETVYGLGADATNASAVEKIFFAKERPSYDPLIVHISDISQLGELVTHIPDSAKKLMERFWPGPLTLVMQKSDKVPDIVTSSGKTVAVRMPAHPVALSLIQQSGKPIAAPSANRFGLTSPTTAQHVQEQLENRIDAIIDGGACTVGIESTVLSLVGDTPMILRPGMIDKVAIEACIGPISSLPDTAGENLESPGLLLSHYAPLTPLHLVDEVSMFSDRSDVGIMLYGKSDATFKGPVEYVSLSEDPQQVASRLYYAMRKLDKLNLSFLVVSLLNETGIGVAVNNRLRKAAYKPSV